jgi:uncharacterized membrane protein YkoI
MKNQLIYFCAVAMMALTLSTAIATPSAAQDNCLGKREIQSAIAAGEILPLAQILSLAGIDSSQEVLSVQVCNRGGEPYYVVAVLDAYGEAQNLVLNARTGSQ